MNEFVEPIEHLSEMFRLLPGIGRKTAVRLAFSVLEFSDETAKEFADAIISAKTDVRECSRCFNMSDHELCRICADPERDQSTLCVVEDSRAVIAIGKSAYIQRAVSCPPRLPSSPMNCIRFPIKLLHSGACRETAQ